MADELTISEIFEAQLALQEKMRLLRPGMTPSEMMTFMTTMILGAEDELHEALAELSWKPWSSAPPGFRDRDKFVGELRDALQLIINMLLAADVTPGELSEAFRAKWAVNHARASGTYDGTFKCDYCRRALDEPGLGKPVASELGFRYCSDTCRREDEADNAATQLRS